jgi:hypothetical protein
VKQATTASLVERIEAARGADRDLDFAIAAAVGWPDSPHSHQHARRYTESLDAAAELVPAGRDWLVGTHQGAPCAVVAAPNNEGAWCAASTAALALCAASLRAMEALAE